jgi:hypothetical protein
MWRHPSTPAFLPEARTSLDRPIPPYNRYVDIDVQVGGMEFLYWLAKIGKSRATGYRWRAEGRLHTVNIDGKLFITQQEIDRFWTRAKAGEFAKQPHGACIPEPAA